MTPAGPRFIAWRERDRRFLLPMLILAVVLGILVGVLYVAFTVVRVDGDSMAPVLLDGDRVLVSRGYDDPGYGDVVSVSVLDRDELVGVLKRVVGLPGDAVRTVGDVAYVNGVVSSAAPDAVIGSDARVSESIVPHGAIYVLGDNRPVSQDSRFIGPVPLANVQGEVIAVILPIRRFAILDVEDARQ